MSPTPGSTSTSADLEKTIDDLARQLAERTAERDDALARQAAVATERDEALAQQRATAEVLGVINSSPGDLAPVFDAILDKALRLCEATHGHIWGAGHAAAVRGDPTFGEWLRQQRPTSVVPGSSVDRLRRGEPLVHILDCREVPPYRSNPYFRELIDRGGIRTSISVPLRKDGALLGTIVIYRQEVRPFSDKEIALLENFAAQAVIAMENARLLTETREALEQQTATAEVLGVINSSPGDLAPVFDAMLQKAHHLLGVDQGGLCTYDGEHFRAVATRGLPEEMVEVVRRPFRGNAYHQQLVGGGRYIHIPDMLALASEELDAVGKAGSAAGVRTTLLVPLRKDGALLGHISANRCEVRPFSDKEIALLENFAAQAVIAMENARLITETREALEQQTATAEVLQVINSSPGDLTPVFDAILEKAHVLCGTARGGLALYDGEYFRLVALHGYSEAVAEAVRHPFPGSDILLRMVGGAPYAHVPDILAIASEITDPVGRLVVESGARTWLGIPLRKESTFLGFISATRTELRPFSDKEIALLQNFAAQAVIAMENARLLGELRERTHDLEESLEYQTATSDVLQVISRSTFDLQPVLEKLLEAASRLCGDAEAALALWNGEAFRTGATAGLTPEFDAAVRARLFPPGRHSTAGRVALERQVVHIPDVTKEPGYEFSASHTVGQIRTTLGVPLLRQSELVGCIILMHRRVEPFTERQIELVRTFADQAVIAIENTRLLTELRESLEQQQAMAEVLQVINRSPGDLEPVFETILEKAHALCGATLGTLYLFDGETFRPAAAVGYPEGSAPLREIKVSEDPRLAALRDGARLTHVADLSQLDDSVARVVAARGVRTNLLLPLRQEGTLLGVITCNRHEIRPFAEKEIALLENFATQAVIAMDNARLLEEIRQRQAELRVTFDNMGDGVAMFDGEMRLAAWNLNFQKILDLPDEFVAGRPSLQEYFRYMEARGEYGTAAPEIEAEIRHGVTIAEHETRFERTRPDGTVIEVRRNAVPGGGSVLIFSDVTERKRAEAEIRAARDAAERALGELKLAQANLIQVEKMASLGQLTAGIAHEIKNPLNFVNNFAGLSVELLGELKEAAAPGLERLDDDTRAEIDETVEMLTGNLEKIAEHGRRADGIVRSMLEHSRGVSGERRVVDLNALVEEALNLAYHGARAQDQSFNITLEREFAGRIAPIELVPQDVTRVFLNLFGNGFYAATKRAARESGNDAFEPLLKVVTRDLGDAVEVLVRDNGIGIPPDIKDKLFQPFFTTKPTGEGTGLGLSISYDIVTQQHGGTIAVESKPGEFTEFTIRLPRISGAAAVEVAP